MINKMNTNNIFVIILIGIIFCLVFVQNSSASIISSNESIQAKESLAQAEKDIIEMTEKAIPINRVNETYQEALQLYSAQLALEEKRGRADYKLVMSYVSNINLIKKTAIQSSDELTIFKETYEEAEKHSNLSEMQEEYDLIIQSFKDERFEDTLELIKKGYDRVSEIQSSQAVLNSLYLATSRTLKNFFVNNWLKITIICSIAFFLILIFWNNIKKLMFRIKFNNLLIRKRAINKLLKSIQESYFKTKKLSESEYNIKLKKFKELIRDIDRQIMVLKEEVFKFKKKI
jgi:hypothetical protein